MKPKLIYKDRHLLVIDKPAGMATLITDGGMADTLESWLVGELPKQKNIEEAGLVHRLDNETSGLIVAARTEDDYAKLRAIWSGKKVLKEYTALVIGSSPARGKIAKAIAHHPDKSNKMIVVENAVETKELKARLAETDFEMLESFLDYTLIKVRINQGLRHQIRCHLSFLGYPLAGDKLYRKRKHEDRDWLHLERHFLHASKLSFPHPSSAKVVTFESPLPEELVGALERLRN